MKGCGPVAVCRGERRGDILVFWKITDALHGPVVERNEAAALRAGAACGKNAVSQTHVFPAGMQNFRLGRTCAQKQMDGLGAGPYAVFLRKAGERAGFFRAEHPALFFSGEGGVSEGFPIGKDMPAHGAVPDVFHRPENAAAGDGKLRHVQREESVSVLVFLDNRRGEGIQTGQNMRAKVPSVRIPAALMSADKEISGQKRGAGDHAAEIMLLFRHDASVPRCRRRVLSCHRK